jgi:hypothetical protein
MDYSITHLSATTACHVITCIGAQDHSQAGIPEQENIDTQVSSALTASRSNHNIDNYHKGAAGRAATFEAFTTFMPTGSVLHPRSIDFV